MALLLLASTSCFPRLVPFFKSLNFLRKYFHACGVEFLPLLYQDFALLRIIAAASKLRALEILARYFSFSYSMRTLESREKLATDGSQHIVRTSSQRVDCAYRENFGVISKNQFVTLIGTSRENIQATSMEEK